MDILSNILQTFGFPVALAIALVYWWRKDYADLVKRVRQVEEARATELKAYANSYKTLSEKVTEALKEGNLLHRQLLRKLGATPWDETDRITPPPHNGDHREQFRPPVPFPTEKQA